LIFMRSSRVVALTGDGHAIKQRVIALQS